MKVLVITQDEPFYLPVILSRVIEQRRRDILGVVILASRLPSETMMSFLRKHLELFGLKHFILLILLYLKQDALKVLSRVVKTKHHFSVEQIAKLYGLPIYRPEKVNSPAFLEEVRKLDPDVILSVAPPQIFKAKLLRIPKMGCINVHSGLLPRQRGLMPNFWVLLNEEKKTGVSVHYMDEKIDSGGILRQGEIEIEPNETLHSLTIKAKKLGARLVLEALDDIEKDKVNALPNPPEEATYFSFPTREDGRKFRSMGLKFR